MLQRTQTTPPSAPSKPKPEDEDPTPQFNFAPFVMRLGARLVDQILLNTVALLVAFATAHYLNGLAGADPLTFSTQSYVLPLALLIDFLAYGPWGEAQTGTLGKRALGMYTLRQHDYRPLSLLHAYRRSMIKLVFYLPLLYGLLQHAPVWIAVGLAVAILPSLPVLSTPRRQTIYDRLTGTIVVGRQRPEEESTEPIPGSQAAAEPGVVAFEGGKQAN
jgi:uncharacterized RDD family membrane protein YckC